MSAATSPKGGCCSRNPATRKASLPAGAWLAEIGFLGFGRDAAERLVARRKAAEAIDHRPVLASEIEILRITEAREAIHAQSLLLAILGVHQRHVEKGATLGCDRFVPTPRERSMRQIERQTVGSECLTRSAVNVTRELIEQNDRGKQRIGIAIPSRRTARQHGIAQGAEARGNRAIERIILGEPLLLRRLVEPEGQDALRCRMDFACPRP